MFARIFCLELAKTFIETFQMLKQAYGKDCLSRTQCKEWYQRFKSGITSTEEGLPKLSDSVLSISYMLKITINTIDANEEILF
jgi:hypothetical protein